ncbi:tetratricopeptide repeat protein [Rhodobacteraceae bacterium CCMM004]|nr:tetratricopeptide repeat protein [Rhodobacteraceae bacterium CCMM004]
MTIRQSIAQHGTEICVGAFGLASLGAGAVAAPVAVLATMGAERLVECDRAILARARQGIEALEDLGRLDDGEAQRVRDILRSGTITLTFTPTEMLALRESPTLPADLSRRLLPPGTLAHETDGVREAVHMVLTTAFAALFQAGRHREAIAFEAMLTVLDRQRAQITGFDAFIADMAQRHGAMLDALVTAGEERSVLLTEVSRLRDEARRAEARAEERHTELLERFGSFENAIDSLAQASRDQLEAIAARFEIAGTYDLSDAELRQALEKRAEDWRTLRDEVEAIPDGMLRLSNLKAAARDAVAKGDLDEVETLLQRVQEVELEEAARTAELRADNALLRGRVDQAAVLLAAAADSFAGIDPLEPARRRILHYAETLGVHGLRYGGTGLARSHDLLAPVLTDRLRAADDWLWAAGMNARAVALRNQGTRTGGPGGAALLAEAVAAYRAALDVRTRDAHPVDWAGTQNNLGNALSDQGTRTGGPEGAALLAEAVAACRAALDVYTRDAHPVQWATTQNNLGIALRNQGTRTGGPEGAALLAEAVAAFRAALDVRTRDAHPVDWAMTQTNLGNALADQGTRTGGPEGAALLAEAVAAFRAALEVRTRDAHPVDWAATQNNLGIALADQGTRTGGPQGAALLAEAVTAYRAALDVTTRDAHPVDWAVTQNNLGAALQEQGTRTGGPEGAALLAEAVAAYRAALDVRTRDAHPVDWAMTRENLAIAEVARAQHDTCDDPRGRLESALAHVQAALEVYDPVHMPYDHGTATRLRDRIRAALDAL